MRTSPNVWYVGDVLAWDRPLSRADESLGLAQTRAVVAAIDGDRVTLRFPTKGGQRTFSHAGIRKMKGRG